MHANKRFGDYAVELGFCTRADVERAVEIQEDLQTRGYPHLLIGLVMIRYGIIDNAQLIHILKTLDREHVESLLPC